MGITAEQGPLVTFGQAPSGNAIDTNSEAGPNAWYQGDMLLDPRTFYTYFPGQGQPPSGASIVRGWYSTASIMIADYVPSTLSTTNYAAAQVPTAGTALTLVAASGSGVTVGCQVYNANTGVLVTGLLGIDVNSATNPLLPVTFGAGSTGSGGPIGAWNPGFVVGRNVQIASVGNDSTATFTVRGYDAYGYPLTETITGANIGTATGKKAFKFIASITPAGTLSGSNVSAGAGDTYGLALRTDYVGWLEIWWASALVSSSTGFTAADTTSPATATTGDVRGTYHVQSASNGTDRLNIFISQNPNNITTQTGMLGVAQYSG